MFKHLNALIIFTCLIFSSVSQAKSPHSPLWFPVAQERLIEINRELFEHANLLLAKQTETLTFLTNSKPCRSSKGKVLDFCKKALDKNKLSSMPNLIFDGTKLIAQANSQEMSLRLSRIGYDTASNSKLYEYDFDGSFWIVSESNPQRDLERFLSSKKSSSKAVLLSVFFTRALADGLYDDNLVIHRSSSGFYSSMGLLLVSIVWEAPEILKKVTSVAIRDSGAFLRNLMSQAGVGEGPIIDTACSISSEYHSVKKNVKNCKLLTKTGNNMNQKGYGDEMARKVDAALNPVVAKLQKATAAVGNARDKIEEKIKQVPLLNKLYSGTIGMAMHSDEFVKGFCGTSSLGTIASQATESCKVAAQPVKTYGSTRKKLKFALPGRDNAAAP